MKLLKLCKRKCPLIKFSEELQLVGTIVYEPNTPDLDDEYTDETEIRKAAHKYLVEHRTMTMMHQEVTNDTQLVESYIAPVDMVINKQRVKKGSWLVVFEVLTDRLWKSIKDGVYTGISMGGRCNHEEGN